MNENNLSDAAKKILDEPYCDPTKRMDFVLIYDVRDGNPNGDPDAGNLPRMDPSNRHGIVTDVCMKRKIRDYLHAQGRPIYIQSSTALNTLYYRAAADLARDPVESRRITLSPVEVLLAADDIVRLYPEGETLPDEDKQALVARVQSWLSQLDVEGMEFRPDDSTLTYFGEAKSLSDFKEALVCDGVLTGGDTKVVDGIAKKLVETKKGSGKKGSGAAKLTSEDREKVKWEMCARFDDIRLFGAVLTAGTNAGQILGPMQLTFGRSIEPIQQWDAAITRCAITKASDRERKQTEFGRKPWLSWAVYRQHGFFNAPLAAKTKVTKEDLARFWEAVAGMFSTPSASKGQMALRDLIVFVHPCTQGNAPSHLLFEKVKVEKRLAGEGELPIRQDGFDGEYAVAVSEPAEACGVRAHRPLKDIWPAV